MKDSNIALVWNGSQSPACLVAENTETLSQDIHWCIALGRGGSVPLKILQRFETDHGVTHPLLLLLFGFPFEI